VGLFVYLIKFDFLKLGFNLFYILWICFGC